MPWYVYLLQFVSGLLFANGVPHFVQGVSGHRFQSPFASPPGVGESSPIVNVLWGFANLAGTVQRSGGSSRLRQLWAWRGDWIEHTTEPGAEHAVVDRAADLKKQIGASPRPSHLLRFIHSPVDQEIRGTFGN